MKKLLVLAWAGAALLSGGMLRAENILLSTRNSSLLLTAEKGKTPLFQYFGARVASPDDILASGAAFGDAAYPQFGAQCYREVAIQATHGDGSMSLELAVESVSRDRRDGSETTAIAMKDKHYPFFVTLFYKTYDDCEVIETWTEISHTEKKPVTLYRFASAYMPVRRGDTWLTHFHGTWGAECYLHEEPLTDGMKVLKNKDGVRNTQRDNPSLMISLDGRPRELTGRVIGGTLAWAGNYRITRRWPTISILILTTYDEDDYAFGGLDAGASGFLLKDVTKHNLIDAVHAIANGDAILTPRITRQVLERGVPHPTSSQRQQEMRKAFDALTPRQREICALISEGLINEEIANQLTVEPASVKRAVTRILATLGLRNRTQIAIGWFKAGM